MGNANIIEEYVIFSIYEVHAYAVKSAKGKKAKAYAVLECTYGANLTAGLYSDQGGHMWICG